MIAGNPDSGDEMKNDVSLHALRNFTAGVTEKMPQFTEGEPEDRLRSPFENFMSSVAAALGWNVVCTGETRLPRRLGQPDYAVHKNLLLVGYVELKAPGIGANAHRFTGRNRAQFKRFSALPNILYSDGNEWAMYRSGERVGKIVRLSGDVATGGKQAAAAEDAWALTSLLRDFFLWEPILPTDGRGRIDLRSFAELLAPLCRMLRDDVTEALKDTASPLVQLAKDWRQLLFPNASDRQFADAYAQTVTFALLLGRGEGADPLTLENARTALATQHSLLSRALQVLTDPAARIEISAPVDLLLRVIAAIPPSTLEPRRVSKAEDAWLYFYEDFLAVYDPALRKNAGVYYTPAEVVRAQVRLIDDLLVRRLHKPLGFADSGVVTLDPAAGTGTYLLGVIEYALLRVAAEQGDGSVAGQATELAKSLYGFELMVGPYAVAQLRVSRALGDRGARLPDDGMRLYLTDTLESPHIEPPQAPLFLQPIAEQHAKALRVKSEVPVIVCLGNPPYDRHEAVTGSNQARTGGWVRLGDVAQDGGAILRDFLEPATAAGHGVRVKNLYNLYVYFWRWALWKVFEHQTARGPGIVSFISASSYLDGDAFCGMREHMRRVCEEIWVLDLGGEGRGTHRNDNIFAIQTPVAITVVFRSNKMAGDTTANVHYARIEGTCEEKLAALDAVKNLAAVDWQDCPDDWQAPFRPAGEGEYFAWPLLTHLMPWQHSGVQFKRTWPIAPDAETLERRWRRLLASPDRVAAFKETPDRKIHSQRSSLFDPDDIQPPIIGLAHNAPLPHVERYAYRSFDRQRIVADTRLGDRLRPILWHIHGERQVYLTTLLNHPLGKGPAATACALIPDLHHFSGRGAKDTVPLYRTADAVEANVTPGLLETLGSAYKRDVAPEDFLAYIYGVLAQPTFTERFESELETRELRVPVTKDVALFEQVRATGARLLWLHTYAERFIPAEQTHGRVPPGAVKCVKAIHGDTDGYPEKFAYDDASRTLHIGAGEFAPVTPEVYEFEVSGLRVVQSWLKYRMKKGAGKKSSPLDDVRPERWTSQLTTDLLELLWVLEATITGYPEQARLLDAVIEHDCFQTDELPPVPDAMRKPPTAQAIARRLL